jgi:imidazolonepropionase
MFTRYSNTTSKKTSNFIELTQKWKTNKMLTLIKNPSQIVTVNTYGKGYLSGKNMNNLYVLENHSIVIEDDLIKDFVPNSTISESKFDVIVEAKDKTVLPGLIDCHTHTAFAGSRSNEFREKLAGVSYEEIARRGGGINATVNAVRNSSFEELVRLIKPRIDYFISQGVTTLEIKSGYGLSYYDEIKLLQVINFLDESTSIDIIPTFLGAHTYPPEYKNEHEKYLELLTESLLPYIAQNKLAKFCDAFCEITAFSPEESKSVLEKAKEYGLGLKLHTDQFNSIGGINVALELGATSVEHLEVIEEKDIQKLRGKEIVAVLLPGVSFFLNYDYAPARALIDNGTTVALSTDYNPGSSHIANLNLIMSLAALKMGMTIEETIAAVTINAAKALNLQDRQGSLEIGKFADLAIFDAHEYSEIVYNIGKNLNMITIKKGKVIYDVGK